MRLSKLYKHLISDENIYNAIYSLESYVFEKYLLSKEDFETYEKLKDKFNDNFISGYIKQCISRLEAILNSDQLFDCKIYLKAKKIDVATQNVEFRPIHTASLLDQICMVALLSILMFDDSKNKRKLSAISRLLPANFYGNLPSNNVKELFKPWNKQFMEYSTNAIMANMNYLKNKKYKYELTLDLIRFFPSINPVFVHNYILEKWPVNADESERKCIGKILEKLLFFNVKLEKDLHKFYYPENMLDKQNLIYNFGIAQGLPQAYFFGNICMTVISKHKNNKFKGDSYLYVDDSIIYTNEKVNQDIIDTLVQDFNKEINKFSESSEFLFDGLFKFHQLAKENYYLHIHPLGNKSEYKSINKIDPLFFLAKPASLLSFEIRTSQDEFEDISLLRKINALIDAIDYLIKIFKDDDDHSQLKRLYRYRKFYVNRLNYLKVALSSDLIYDKDAINKFIDKFELNIEPAKSKFFELLESDVFCFESQIISEQLSTSIDINLRNKFFNTVLNFELSCLNIRKETKFKDYLYFHKVFMTINERETCPDNRYASLEFGKLTQSINEKNRSTNCSKIENIKKVVELVKL